MAEFFKNFSELVITRAIEAGMANAESDPEYQENRKEINDLEAKFKKALSEEGWQLLLDYEACYNARGVIQAKHTYRQGLRDCFALIKELNSSSD